MLSRLLGALLRAAVVVLVIATAVAAHSGNHTGRGSDGDACRAGSWPVHRHGIRGLLPGADRVPRRTAVQPRAHPVAAHHAFSCSASSRAEPRPTQAFFSCSTLSGLSSDMRLSSNGARCPSFVNSPRAGRRAGHGPAGQGGWRGLAMFIALTALGDLRAASAVAALAEPGGRPSMSGSKTCRPSTPPPAVMS